MLLQSTGFEYPLSYSKFPLAIYFTCGNVCVSVLPFQFIPPSPFPTVSTNLSFMSTSPLLPCKKVHQYHLSRFHNIWYLLFSLWLTLLCIISYRFIHFFSTDTNAFLFYGWVIFHCIYVPHFVYPLIFDGHLGCFHVLAIGSTFCNALSQSFLPQTRCKLIEMGILCLG